MRGQSGIAENCCLWLAGLHMTTKCHKRKLILYIYKFLSNYKIYEQIQIYKQFLKS